MLRDRAIRGRMPRAGETSMKTLRAVCPYTRMLHTRKAFSSKALDRSQSAYLPLSEPPQGRGLSRRPGWTRLRQTIPTRTAAPPPPLPPLEESAPAASPSPQPSQGPPTTRLTVPGQLQLEVGGQGGGEGGQGGRWLFTQAGNYQECPVYRAERGSTSLHEVRNADTPRGAAEGFSLQKCHLAFQSQRKP